MSLLALILACLALLVALVALARSGTAHDAAGDAATAARRHAGNVEESLREEVAVLRSLLSRLVGGEEVTAQMVHDGVLWREIDPREAQVLVEGGEVTLVDVRTPEETATGIIPGALLVPMAELEERRGELPKEGPLLVYCAGGGRSAAVCEFLSKSGRTELLNLAGGISAWEGAVERP